VRDRGAGSARRKGVGKYGFASRKLLQARKNPCTCLLLLLSCSLRRFLFRVQLLDAISHRISRNMLAATMATHRLCKGVQAANR
jgi:hypothetical protein